MSALHLPAKVLIINDLALNPVYLYWNNNGLAEDNNSETNSTLSDRPEDTQTFDPTAFTATTAWTNLKGFRVADWGTFYRPGKAENEEIIEVIVTNGWSAVNHTLQICPQLDWVSATESKVIETLFTARSRNKEFEYQQYSEFNDRDFRVQAVVRGASALAINNQYCIAIASYVQELIDAGFKDLKYTLYSNLAASTVVPAGSMKALDALRSGTSVLVVKLEFTREGLEFNKFVADDTYLSEYATAETDISALVAAESNIIYTEKGTFFEGRNTYRQVQNYKIETPANMYPYSGNEGTFPIKGSLYTSIYVKKRIARPDLGGGIVVNQEASQTAEFLIFVRETEACETFVQGFLRFLTDDTGGVVPHLEEGEPASIKATFNMLGAGATPVTADTVAYKVGDSVDTFAPATYPAAYIS